jgi:signal transduction histidine kinase/ActR/RegA family two-component response regulator
MVLVTAAFIWGAWVLPLTPFVIAVVASYLGAFLHHFLWTRKVLKTAEERMVQVEKMHALAELAGGIAHDVRNALAPALVTTDFLLEEVTDPEWQMHLRTVRRGIDDAITIVNRLRLFGKPASEQQVLLPININELVMDTVAFTHAKWYHEPRRRGVEVKVQTHLSPHLPPVLGNPVELRQVLVNLIFNAVEAMPQGGTLTIRTFAENRQVGIAVQDTGIGMSPTVKKRLFEPFFTTKGERGTGLGLSICYGIVLRHRGAIDVESEEGKGTTFIVRLPAASPVESTTEQVVAQLPPLRILLIDDDETGSAALAEVLRRAGHKVDIALSGRDALQRYHPHGYEVVIVDWLMPGMNGLEVARAIRELSPHQPVILSTAWEAQLSAVPSGLVDAVIAKPWTNESLLAALKQALAAQRAV